ncbi:hypothetical protein WR25_04847 [Diploscapter pachys]|uniref:Metalloendopeptidase n=1 Tax=Diploscapter pachys TaxID=2018661 RepID=A0A2A2K7K7_9BILA|nr:hypothetical protein WR25_04847 [Diploscapter pachys]
MHLLIALSFICLISISMEQVRRQESPDDNNAPNQTGGYLGKVRRIDPGNMTEEEAEEYRKKFGFNPRRAKARLQRLKNLGSRRKNKPPTEEEIKRKELRRQKYGNLTLSKPSNDSLDILEINTLNGVDDLLVDGDLMLTDEQLNKLEENIRDENEQSTENGRSKRQLALTSPKWPGNTLYYYVDSTIDASKRQRIYDALSYLQARTCVNFVQSAAAANRVRVTSGNGCYSSIGMVGGEQVLSLGPGCNGYDTTQHEFMHSLGMYHEFSRSDRDSYVRVDLSYVPAALQYNFNKYPSNIAANYYPYEYGSILHYPSNAFVTNQNPPQANAISIDPTDDAIWLWINSDCHDDLADDDAFCGRIYFTACTRKRVCNMHNVDHG